jgi:hypothetical protein
MGSAVKEGCDERKRGRPFAPVNEDFETLDGGFARQEQARASFRENVRVLGTIYKCPKPATRRVLERSADKRSIVEILNKRMIKSEPLQFISLGRCLLRNNLDTMQTARRFEQRVKPRNVNRTLNELNLEPTLFSTPMRVPLTGPTSCQSGKVYLRRKAVSSRPFCNDSDSLGLTCDKPSKTGPMFRCDGSNPVCLKNTAT